MQEVKSRLLKVEGFTVTEDNGEETIISWCNEKDTVLGTAYLSSHELRFETNSDERLGKWKSIIKNMPVEFIETESTDLQSVMEERLNDPDLGGSNLEKSVMGDIPAYFPQVEITIFPYFCPH